MSVAPNFGKLFNRKSVPEHDAPVGAILCGSGVGGGGCAGASCCGVVGGASDDEARRKTQKPAPRDDGAAMRLRASPPGWRK